MAAKHNGNPRIGSSLDDHLREEGVYDEIREAVAKEVLAWQVEQALTEQAVSRSELARRMHTSRDVVNRLLDPKNTSVNLRTMERAASALGRRLTIRLELIGERS